MNPLIAVTPVIPLDCAHTAVLVLSTPPTLAAIVLRLSHDALTWCFLLSLDPSH